MRELETILLMLVKISVSMLFNIIYRPEIDVSHKNRTKRKHLNKSHAKDEIYNYLAEFLQKFLCSWRSMCGNFIRNAFILKLYINQRQNSGKQNCNWLGNLTIILIGYEPRVFINVFCNQTNRSGGHANERPVNTFQFSFCLGLC